MMLSQRRASPLVYALLAILLWGSLARLGVLLSQVPPFFVVGVALTGAGTLALPTWRHWRINWGTLALGVYGLFGYHFCLFMALRLAPAVNANLINYLWPLLIVLLSPVFDRRLAWSMRHVLAALAGFAGAALVILRSVNATDLALDGRVMGGYACAFVAAVIWATYSLGTQRAARSGRGFANGAVGLFCMVSGVLALLCHGIIEPTASVAPVQWIALGALAVGPMGAAFFLWDGALRHGDPRVIGTLAYLTPLCSTLTLVAPRFDDLSATAIVGLVLIVAAAAVGSRA